MGFSLEYDPPAGGWTTPNHWHIRNKVRDLRKDDEGLNKDIKDIYRCRNQATLRNMAQYALKWGEFLELMFRALALRNGK